MQPSSITQTYLLQDKNCKPAEVFFPLLTHTKHCSLSFACVPHLGSQTNRDRKIKQSVNYPLYVSVNLYSKNSHRRKRIFFFYSKRQRRRDVGKKNPQNRNCTHDYVEITRAREEKTTQETICCQTSPPSFGRYGARGYSPPSQRNFSRRDARTHSLEVALPVGPSRVAWLTVAGVGRSSGDIALTHTPADRPVVSKSTGTRIGTSIVVVKVAFFPRLRGIWENVRSAIPRLRFVFLLLFFF